MPVEGYSGKESRRDSMLVASDESEGKKMVSKPNPEGV